MRNIKVFLQYPWKFPDSQYYKSLIDFPPKGVSYLNSSREEGAIVSHKKFLFSNQIKKLIRGTLNFFRMSFPNVHKVNFREKFDLIHCAHCLTEVKTPWICDMEGSWQFYVGEKTKTSMENVRKILTSEQCKKILPWTNKTKEDILSDFPELKDKVEVVYPAIEKQKIKKKTNKKLTVIYIARYFKIKGGLIALETLRRLKKECDIDTIFISEVPEKIKNAYPEINIFGLMNKKDLNRKYQEADIFFYPSFVDTFGFTLLEAMSFGLPIVTINTEYTKTREEIIENIKHGFIFDVNEKINFDSIGEKEEAIIEKLKENLKKMVENTSLRKKMSKNCIEEIKEGKFSIKNRNKKMKRIYMEAIA